MEMRSPHSFSDRVATDLPDAVIKKVSSSLLLDVARSALSRSGGERWQVNPEEFWCRVTPPSSRPHRAHGWKLHVSATPLGAPHILARSIEVLVKHECSFKFVVDLPNVFRQTNIRYERGGSGKFITAYPSDDEHLRAVARDLDRVTEDFSGPVILSDRRVAPGSIVQYRYGEIGGGKPVFTDDGVFESFMEGPDGTRAKDERLAWFSPPPWAKSPIESSSAGGSKKDQRHLLGARFRVTGAIRHSNRGGVYQAIDEQGGVEVIVKQARAHVGSGLDGSDVRDGLRYEARMLERLEPLGLFPKKVALFDEVDDLFLALELIPGASLSDGIRQLGTDGVSSNDALDLARELVAKVKAVHNAGLVLHDVSPGNIMLTPDKEVMFIDPELVNEPGQATPSMFTANYVSPEFRKVVQEGGERVPAPEPPSDCFGLGLSLFHAVTGLTTSWVRGDFDEPRPPADRRRMISLIADDYPALRGLSDLIVGLTEEDPAQRWSLEQAASHLQAEDEVLTPPARARKAFSLEIPSLDQMIEDGLELLKQEKTPDEGSLWPVFRSEGNDPCNAWKGAAGILATLTRAARALDKQDLLPLIAESAEWINKRLFEIPKLLPGLCFGRAGTAWALHDAARLLDDDELASRAIQLLISLPTEGPSPDVTHGLSGAGFAHLHLWQKTGNPELLDRAVLYADAVLEAAEHEGEDWFWPISSEMESDLAGLNNYGFAHGVAGCGAFLLAAAEASNNGSSIDRDHFLEAAIGAGDTLARAARIQNGYAVWPESAGSDRLQYQPMWCNGPPGIGTFLLRLGMTLEEERYTDLADQCAPRSKQRWNPNVGACCGLAGAGQLLLDLADFNGEGTYRSQAEEIAAVIDEGAVSSSNGLRGLSRSNSYDAQSGTAGVLDFLLRLRHGGQSPWLPAPSQRLPVNRPAISQPEKESNNGGLRTRASGV